MQSIIRGFLTSSRRQCQAPPATATGTSVQAVSQGRDDTCYRGMDKCLELACKGVWQQMHAFQARPSPKMAANKWDTLIEDVLVRDSAMHSPNEFIAENKADESIWPVDDIDGFVKLFPGCPNAAISWEMDSAMLTVPQAGGIVMDTPVNPLHLISLWLLLSKQRDNELKGVEITQPVDQDSARIDELPRERAAEESIVAIAKEKDAGKSKKSSGKTCPQQPKIRKQKRKLARRPPRKPCGTPNKRDDSKPGDPCMPGYSL